MMKVTNHHLFWTIITHIFWKARTETGICVDPGEAAPLILELERRGLRPDIIFNTHHHGDRIAGNAELKRLYQGHGLAAPAKEQSRIDRIDIELAESIPFSFGWRSCLNRETPGHTRGGLCIRLYESKIIFTGDTLFQCGRLLSTPAQMWVLLKNYSITG
ncbi:MAG: MBL fold metallo-hydrolase [Alphaproteobacteria bacterium]